MLKLKAIILHKIVIFYGKLKKLPLYYLSRLIFILFSLIVSIGLKAQEIKISGQLPDSTAMDTIPLPDTIVTDSTLRADSLKTKKPQGDIETAIQYNAKDSMHFDIPHQIVYLYGSAKITYGEIELEAEEIQIDWVHNMLTAKGGIDSVGKPMGQPVFKDGAETFETENIKYNFKTRKAYITGVTTKQDEGLVYGKTVKKNEKNEVFIKDGWYTTCECEPGEKPDLYIKSSKLKLIPKDKVIAGPFHLVIADVPTPLGLPFGLFPMPRRQNSGIIVPAYGEERNRGFFLRDGGYYFDINDNVNLTLLGEIYSKGSYGFGIQSQYYKRYAYRGNLNFRFNRQKLNSDSNNPQDVKDFTLAYSHQPQSTGRNSRYSASVNIATNTYTQNNPTGNIEDNLRTTLSSNMQYSVTFPNSPFNMSVSFRHNQNLITKEVNVSLPEFSLGMNRIYPFQGKSGTANNVFQKISVGWTAQGTNRISNRISFKAPNLSYDEVIQPEGPADSVIAFNMANLPILLENAQNGIRHTVPISTSFNLLKFFTVSPSFNYEEIWYFKKLDYTFVPDSNKVAFDRINGFSRAYSYNASAGVSTRLYGYFPFRGEKVQAIRHTINPTLSIGYRPDFGDEKYGFYQKVRKDNEVDINPQFGTDNNEVLLSRYTGFPYGSPSAGKSGAIGFGITNQLEMKVKNENDTTENAEATKKIPILEQLSFNGSYNFMADSFRLSPISISARTRLLDGKINISGSASLDPYAYNIDNRQEREGYIFQYKQDRYAWQEGQGIGRITSANLTLSTSLNPKAREKEQEEREEEEASGNYTAEELAYIDATRDQYIDWDVPWNIRLNYSINYRRNMLRTKENPSFGDFISTHSVSFSGDVSLTEKWKISYNSGYDLKRKEFTITNLNVHRDLGCFEMSFNWVPFGRLTSYSFQVNVKSSLLKDLKLQRRNSFYDR